MRIEKWLFVIGSRLTPDGGLVKTLFGNGDGTFQAAIGMLSGVPFPFAVATGDFNADGNADLAVTYPGDRRPATHNFSKGSVAVLLAYGNGTFTRPNRCPNVRTRASWEAPS